MGETDEIKIPSLTAKVVITNVRIT